MGSVTALSFLCAALRHHFHDTFYARREFRVKYGALPRYGVDCRRDRRVENQKRGHGHADRHNRRVRIVLVLEDKKSAELVNIGIRHGTVFRPNGKLDL